MTLFTASNNTLVSMSNRSALQALHLEAAEAKRNRRVKKASRSFEIEKDGLCSVENGHVVQPNGQTRWIADVQAAVESPDVQADVFPSKPERRHSANALPSDI